MNRAREVMRRLATAVACVILMSATVFAWADITVVMTNPTNGAQINPPGAAMLGATASATDGYAISKVEFYIGSTLIGSSTSPIVGTYYYAWGGGPGPGNYVMTAKATATKAGNPDQTATSSPANVTILTPPTVTFTSPADYSSYTGPATVTLSANVTPASGTTISSVSFYWNTCCGNDPVLIGTVTTPPYTVTATDLPDNVYFIYADAIDNRGVAGSAGLTLGVGPAVTLTSPANGANYSAPASIALAASGPGYYIEADFYQGSTWIGAGFYPSYSFTWQNVPVGTYTLTAKLLAGDATGFSWTTAPVTVTVASPAAQQNLYFVHTDHLNTPRLIIDSIGTTVWRYDNTEPFGASPPDENPSGLGAFEFPLRFAGQYADRETNLRDNWFRTFDPARGEYLQSDPIGLQGGINTYLYVGADPLNYVDPKGLSGSNPGGPYHQPSGVTLRCTRFDSCPVLRGKMWVLKRMIDSHQGWDWNNPSPMGGGRHAEEIDGLWRAYARCQSIYAEKCRETCPAPDLKSIGMGIGALGLGAACAINPLACGIGLGIGGAVGGGLAPAQ